MRNFVSAAILMFCCMMNIHAQTVPSYVPTFGLVGWWPFNGNATDESVNTNDGIVYGATLTTDRFGVVNSAYNFNGVSNYIEVPSNTQLSFTSAYSISAWVNLNNYTSTGWPNQAAIVSKVDGTGWYGGYELVGLSDASGISKNLFTSGNIGGANVSLNKSGLSINQWYNAIVTYNGFKIKLFVNGVCVDSLNKTGNLQTSSNSLRFGRRRPSFDNFLNGKIDDVCLWNRALTNCEIQQLYTSSLNTFTFSALSSSSIICKGQSATLIASGASSYTWQPSSVVNSSTTVTPLTTSLYTVVATNTAGCISTRTISITVKPTPTIAVSSGTICKGQSFTITPSGASTYTYSSGSSVVSPTLTTTYSVTGTNTLGCVSTSPTTLTVFVFPCTGIDELENNQSIVFYPNPFTNEIYVKVEGDIKNKKYLIYTASGQLIQSGILNGNKINCSDFPKGLYFIKLEGSAKAFKLVKEN
jgi:hypothetical protein